MDPTARKDVTPTELEDMAVQFHKELVNNAFAKASRGRNVDADIDQIEQFEDACRREGVYDWDGGSIALIRLASNAAVKRGE